MAFIPLEDLRFAPSKRNLNDDVILARFLSREYPSTDAFLVSA